jgi:hydrogenase nickel incorporation protein HypA/HybF
VHEVSIVEALIDQVGREVAARGHSGRVTKLGLVIGRLSGVHVDAVRFALELLAPGTLLESAEVHIDQPKAVCCCTGCGARAEVEELVARCPGCASADVTIEGGRELLLGTIELEEPAP